MSPDDEKIYQSCLSRITDLNKTVFNYRLLYVSLLAGFFASLTFIQNLADRATIIHFVDAYLMIAMFLALSVLIGIFVISMFDCTHQELVEHAISAAESIEFTNRSFEGKRIFARPTGSVISLYINLCIFFFYAIPGFIIFGFGYIVHDVTKSDSLIASYPALNAAICPLAEVMEPASGQVVGLPTLGCSAQLAQLKVDELTKGIVDACFWISIAFGLLFLLVQAHRIVGRILRCLIRPQYPEETVSESPYLHDNALKMQFDKYFSMIIILCASILIMMTLVIGTDLLFRHL